MDRVLLSTGNNSWGTPQKFFDRLNQVFRFTLDPCADENNHKCDKFYTVQDDGLSQNWGGQVVFCNPPYSRRTKDNPGQEDWIEKCCSESENNKITAVMLIPARTDTRPQHEYVFAHAKYICFVRGRLKFNDGADPAPFPSEVVVFTQDNFDEEIKGLSDLGFWIKLRE